jgi:hypothetical protein
MKKRAQATGLTTSESPTTAKFNMANNSIALCEVIGVGIERNLV